MSGKELIGIRDETHIHLNPFLGLYPVNQPGDTFRRDRAISLTMQDHPG